MEVRHRAQKKDSMYNRIRKRGRSESQRANTSRTSPPMTTTRVIGYRVKHCKGGIGSKTRRGRSSLFLLVNRGIPRRGHKATVVPGLGRDLQHYVVNQIMREKVTTGGQVS